MTVLLLAGTTEARVLATLLARAGVDAIASLAGATRDPAPLVLPTHTGGFGGYDAQVEFMKANGINAVLDATHPFASRISHRTAAICGALGVPCLHLLRPPWQAGPGDDWTVVASAHEADRHIPPGATVFLATGRGTLQEFKGLADRHLICRQIDRPDRPFPFENGEFLIGRPPFSVEDEIAQFAARKVDWLVVKNAGGQASRTKLDAARALGLPVLMIARPDPPPGTIVQTPAQAMDWLAAI